MSNSSLITALRTELRPLGSLSDTAAVEVFCAALRDEPRYFGPNAEPKVGPLSTARLLHPAGPTCVGAFVGQTLVGLARLEAPRSAGSTASLIVVVRKPWRRSGVASKLLRCIAHDDSVRSLRSASMIVAKNNRAALALARACGMDRTEVAVDRVELTVRLGWPALRCA